MVESVCTKTFQTRSDERLVRLFARSTRFESATNGIAKFGASATTLPSLAKHLRSFGVGMRPDNQTYTVVGLRGPCTIIGISRSRRRAMTKGTGRAQICGRWPSIRIAMIGVGEGLCNRGPIVGENGSTKKVARRSRT